MDRDEKTYHRQIWTDWALLTLLSHDAKLVILSQYQFAGRTEAELKRSTRQKIARIGKSILNIESPKTYALITLCCDLLKIYRFGSSKYFHENKPTSSYQKVVCIYNDDPRTTLQQYWPESVIIKCFVIFALVLVIPVDVRVLWKFKAFIHSSSKVIVRTNVGMLTSVKCLLFSSTATFLFATYKPLHITPTFYFKTGVRPVKICWDIY